MNCMLFRRTRTEGEMRRNPASIWPGARLSRLFSARAGREARSLDAFCAPLIVAAAVFIVFPPFHGELPLLVE